MLSFRIHTYVGIKGKIICHRNFYYYNININLCILVEPIYYEHHTIGGGCGAGGSYLSLLPSFYL